MEVDHGAAPIELIKYRRESRIAWVAIAIACEQADAVSTENIKRIFNLGQARVNVRQGQGHEHAESVGIVAPNCRRIFIAHAAQMTRLLTITKPQTGRRDRRHRFSDTVALHRLDRHVGCPFGRPPSKDQRTDAVFTDGGDVIGWQDVMMNVDAMIIHVVWPFVQFRGAQPVSGYLFWPPSRRDSL